MAFPAAKLRPPDVTVARGNASFRRREGLPRRGDCRKGKPSRGTRRPFRGTVADSARSLGAGRAPASGVSAEAGIQASSFPLPPPWAESVVKSRLGCVTQPRRRLRARDPQQGRMFQREETSASTLAGQAARSRSQESYPRDMSYPAARGSLPVSLSLVK